MLEQARTELPNECCGLLAGRMPEGEETTERMGRVVQRYPLVNAVASPREYLSDPQSMFAAFKDMREQGLDVLAVYHSHPTSPPVPSKKDLEQNYSPEVVNFIISFASTEPEIRGWWL